MSIASNLAAVIASPKPAPITLGDRVCIRCGDRERMRVIKGTAYSTISQQLGICFECLNQELSLLAPLPPL